MLYRSMMRFLADRTDFSWNDDLVSSVFLSITRAPSDILSIARVGDDPVISLWRKSDRSLPRCIWCNAHAEHDVNFLNADSLQCLPRLPRTSQREIVSCKRCIEFATPIVHGDRVYNIYPHAVCIAGEVSNTFIDLPARPGTKPILSCPEAQNVCVLVSTYTKYELYLISDQIVVVPMPYAPNRRFSNPFMRDATTLCAWEQDDRLVIWDTRTDSAPVHTVDENTDLARESSAFIADNLFLSISSTCNFTMSCGTYDLRNVSDAITVTPTHANAIV